MFRPSKLTMKGFVILVVLFMISCHSGRYMGIPSSQLNFNICYTEPCNIEIHRDCCGSKRFFCWNNKYIYTYENFWCTSAEYKLFEYRIDQDSVIALEKDYYMLDTNVGFVRQHCRNRGITWKIKDFRNTYMDTLIIEGSKYYKEINFKTRWANIKKTQLYKKRKNLMSDC